MAASYRYIIGASALSILASTAAAGAQDLDLGEIVVTPNRVPTELSKTGSSVSVVNAQEIERQSLPLVSDYLTMVPGINVASQGGAGKLTTFMMRGVPGEYTKTLINGIDVSEVSGTKIQAPYGQFLAGIVQRMEVLKGSQSTLYGSDAIAGVVDLTTLGTVEPGLRHRIHTEGGSNGTFFGSYALEGGFDRGEFGLSLAGFRTDGFSAAAVGTEDDGFENVTATFTGEYEITPGVTIFGSGIHLDSQAEFDDFPPPDFLLDDSNAFSDFRLSAGRIGTEFALFDGRLVNTVSAQLGRSLRESVSGSGDLDTFEGRRAKLDYLGSFELSPDLTLNFGADWERQKADTSSGVDASITMGGGWIEAIYSPVEHLTLTAGLRHDEHSSFGGHTVWRITGSYDFADTGTRIHSSVGTGYRAPSLYELYAPTSGNDTLQPETSLGFDIGVEQRFLGGRLVTDATFFMLDIDDFIGFDSSPPFQSIQTDGTVRTRGVELSLAYAATSWFDLKGAYTYTKSTQPDGTRQVRVPRHDIGLSAVVRPAEKWELSATARIALDTVDFEGADKTPLDDYLLLNAKIAYHPNENTELYLRAENLLDQDYQTVRGYSTPGFSVFAGLRATFGP